MSEQTLDLPEERQNTGVHLGWALVLICVAQLMVVLDATIANIALPFIGADLNISQANLTWIVTGYALAFGGLLLLGGRLGDLFGRRLIFSVGLVVFAVASLLGGLATNEGLLLGARGLQGLGAALASPAALALITTTFPAGPQRNRAMAMYATMSGVGAAIGLILGGWLTDLDTFLGLDVDGWRLTFLINVPIGIVAAVLALRLLPESKSGDGTLDFPGAITGTLGLLGIVFGLSRAGERAYGWEHWQTISSLVAGVVLLAAFVLIETRTRHPLLPLRILTNRTRAVSFGAMMIAPAAMFAMFFFLSQFVQGIKGYDALEAGFAFLPFSFGIVFGAGLASNLISRIDPRFLAGTGTLLASLSLYMFSRISVDDSVPAVLGALAKGETVGADLNYWTAIFPWIVVMAAGMGMVFVPMTLTAVHHVAEADSGIGSGVLNTMQQVGGALGLAILSTVGLHHFNDTADQVAGPLAQGMAANGIDPNAVVPGSNMTFLEGAIWQGSFTDSATAGFFVGTFMMLTASLLIWTLLNVRHKELATDGPGAVHVG